jgi:hypothetical protein
VQLVLCLAQRLLHCCVLGLLRVLLDLGLQRLASLVSCTPQASTTKQQ